MNYNELTKDEINELVIDCLGIEYEIRSVHCNTGLDSSKHHFKNVIYKKLTTNKKYWRVFDPCNIASDAWQLIIEHHISLECYTNEDRWLASSRDMDQCIHKNPLRAAMIVFLMINSKGIDT